MKRVRIVHRNLGRERAAGQAHSDGLIELDPRLSPKEWQETLYHELLHIAYPEMTEEEVDRGAKLLIKHAWRQGLRRVVQ